MEICKKQDCCGCASCYSVCKYGAINMVQDEQGFFYPEINETKCVECGLCIKRCPVNYRDSHKITVNDQKVYAAFSKTNKIRKSSSSGGIFSILAEEVINQGGVVFGVKWNEKLVATHDYCEKIEDLKAFRTSKYVQSNAQEIYSKVKGFLEKGRLVLFSGTPCHIEALNLFLSKKYSNLLTVDVVCHGVPSPGLLANYIDYLNNKHGISISSVRFRAKIPAWLSSSNVYCYGNKGDSLKIRVFEDPYFITFVNNVSLRDSCYNCRFSNTNRPSDISLCDYWGYKPTKLTFLNYYKKGISAVIINTGKGNEIFSNIKNKLNVEVSDIVSVAKGNRNLTKPQNKPENVDAFWELFVNNKLNWDDYNKPTSNLSTYIPWKVFINYQIIGFLKVILPDKIIELLKRVRTFFPKSK